MSENNLFQFAKVVAELPVQNTANNQTKHNNSNSSNDNSINHHSRNNNSNRYLPLRKNACVVCSVCFTCSKFYGVDCICQEAQPRRGKNLPQGGLDSRAKKLHREDQDDFEFSIKWIHENAHAMYKDKNGSILGLRDLCEVSLCKAHSSTLYRAKKRHERGKDVGYNHHRHTTASTSTTIDPPSPVDSTSNQPFIFVNNPYPLNHHSSISSGGLATKVKEISNTFQQEPSESASSSIKPLMHSTSQKRKRFNYNKSSPPKLDLIDSRSNYSSVSTPLFSATNYKSPSFRHTNSFIPQQQYHMPSFTIQQDYNNNIQSPMSSLEQQSTNTDSFPSQLLPPLHSRGQQQYQFNSYSSTSPQQQMNMYSQQNNTTSPRPSHTTTTSHNNQTSAINKVDPSTSASTMMDYQLHSPPSIVVETVSLKRSVLNSDDENSYCFQNLAITNTFTFRDLLAELDITGSPPAGKRIMISDSKKFYPLDEAIRNVIRRPSSTHLELCLSLTDKASINWNTMK